MPRPLAQSASDPESGPGDESSHAALTAAFIEHAPALVAWLKLRANRIAGARFDADDVAQEVWLRAVSKLADFDPNRAAFRSWLFGLAANVLLESRRSERLLSRIKIPEGHSTMQQQFNSVPDTVTSITSRLARDDALLALLADIERRDATDRRIFQLRGLEGRSHANVAQILDLSVVAVTKRWRRLLDELSSHPLTRQLLAMPH